MYVLMRCGVRWEGEGGWDGVASVCERGKRGFLHK